MSEAFPQDLRYAVRQLRRTGRPAAIVVATLGISIAAAATLFSLLNGIVLRRLPVREPDRLAAMSVTDGRGQAIRRFDYATYAELAATQQVFEGICGYSGGGVLALEARGALVDGGVAGMTPECLTLLGVRPILGRLLEPEDAPGLGEPAGVVVLGYEFWRRHFGADSAAVGERLVIDGTPLLIVGVLEPAFGGLHVDGGSDVYLPLTLLGRLLNGPDRPVRAINLIGRLRPGVSLEQARAAVTAAWPALRAGTLPAGLTAAERADRSAERVRVEPGARGFSPLRQRYAAPLTGLVGLSVLLLLVGCMNLSGLLLARVVARARQLSVHLALGAPRSRIVRVLVIENLLLTITSTLIAVPLAWAASRALAATLWNSHLPLALGVTPDARVLATMAGVAIVAGLVVSGLPALAIRRGDPRLALRAGTLTAPAGRLGRALVVVQVAVSLVLLFGAGLFAVSLSNLRALDTGAGADGILFARAWQVPGPRRTYDEQTYYPMLVERLSAIPGVRSVALSHYFPAYFNVPALSTHAIAPADAADEAGEVDGQLEFVSPRFFETVGASILQGRDITWDDRSGSPAVAIINQTLARRLFPGGGAVGARIRIGADPGRQSVEVIGIASDVTVGNLRSPHLPVVFRPRLQEPRYVRVPIVLVQAGGDAQAVAPAIDPAIRAFGHEYTRSLSTLEEHLDNTLVQERLLSGVSGFFAALAALLASVGLYGLLAQTLASRAREIGIRLALGASRARINAIFLREGMGLTALGVLMGVPCAMGAGRMTASLLYGLEALNPLTLASVSVTLAAVALMATLLPARRASSIDPASILRSD